jgi:hypothetical protein
MLHVRQLRLRAFTSESVFGCDIRFDKPVNIIRADNTSGKSTCLQAVIYALGLERSFGPKIGIPMTFAMQERIQRVKDGEYENVVKSFVEMEIQNESGEIVTIHRDIKGSAQPKLVQTWPGGLLTGVGEKGQQRDFFVHDAGAAQNDAGFHAYLAKFIGFKLPNVTRYDGGESPLYLEALFPMFFVEQKRGWSALQGPFPTHLQLQDMARRVMEFILDLDVGRVRRELAELRVQLRDVVSVWTRRREELLGTLRAGCRLSGLPAKPAGEFAQNPDVQIEHFLDGEWQPMRTALSVLKQRQTSIQSMPAPSIQAEAPAVETELANLRLQLDEISLRQEDLRDHLRARRQQQLAIEARLADLHVDLERNQDALKLKNLGSLIGHAAADHQCPTCHQAVETELLPLISGATMGLEKNIEFIKSQIILYEASHKGVEREVADLQSLGAALQQQSVEIRARIRALRQALVQPADTPSIAALEAALSAQAKIADITATQERVDEVLGDLVHWATQYAKLEERLSEIGKVTLSQEDFRKIGLVVSSMRQQLAVYGYKSFLPDEITLADDNFRPIAEVLVKGEAVQREIWLNDSASDGTRLKWAYYIAILLLSKASRINHLRLNIFDEPGQQEVEWESLQAFLRWVGTHVKTGQQVIITTSEKEERIKVAVGNLDVAILNFSGFILQPIE